MATEQIAKRLLISPEMDKTQSAAVNLNAWRLIEVFVPGGVIV
jgi:hypothetical protein